MVKRRCLESKWTENKRRSRGFESRALYQCIVCALQKKENEMKEIKRVNTKIIEIRPAEGGEDSKLFAVDLANAYVRMASAMDWQLVRL